MLDRLGDEAAEALRRDHFRMLREAMDGNGGQEVKTLGDGLMVAFPGALAALACAAEMQRLIAGHNQQNQRGECLGLRIGVNAGEVLNAENDYFGTPVVVAKRLCDRADAGQTLVSDIARVLVGNRGGYRFVERGPLLLKGFADPVTAFEMDWRAHAQVPVTGDRPPDDTAPEPEVPGARLALPTALVSEARTEMVGRVGELHALSAELRRAQAGELRIVLLAGEAGMGKTRLAADFARLAHEQGAEVLYGCSDPEPLVPFQPFVQALARYVEQTPVERLRSEIGTSVAVLSRLLPELGRRFPGEAGAPQFGDPESDRYRLFEAITSLLRGLAERHPIVLVLDDLHWADKSTLALVRHLARSAQDARILLVGTYRDVEVGRGHPLAEMIAARHRSTPLSVLELSGLSREEVAGLIASWAGQQTPSDLAATLWEETEGHPFFVQEVLRHLLETGAIHERRGRLKTSSPAGRLRIPLSIREVIERRLARLDDEVLDLLRLAAVVGRDFTVSLLEQVSENLHGDRLLRLLEDATAARVIAPAPAQFDCFRFSHALIRETLYDGLLPARRVRLHRRIAEFLEQFAEEEPPRYLAELARHYFEAATATNDFAKAIDYGIAAGHQAVAQLAYEEASDHFENALRALQLRPGDARRQCDVLLALGRSRWDTGEYAASRAAFSRASELADRESMPEQQACAALGFGGGAIGFQSGSVDDALIVMLERALVRLDPGDSALRARVTARLCEALTLAAPLERRTALAGDAVAMARNLGEREVLAYVLLRTSWGTSTPDNLDDRIATATELLEITAQLTDRISGVEANWWLMVSLLEAGDVDAARQAAARAVTVASQIKTPYTKWINGAVNLLLAALDSPADELEKLVWHGLMVGQAAQNPSALALFGAQMIYLRYLQGRLPEMHATAVAIAEHFADVPGFSSGRAFVCAEIGLEDEARREFDLLAADDFAGIPRDFVFLSAMDVLSLTCGRLQDRRRAAVLYDLLAPFGDRNIILGTLAAPTGSAHRHLGVLATVMNRLDTAEVHFEAALTKNRALGARHALVLTSVEYADMLVRRDAPDDRRRAHLLIDDAVEAGRSLGLDGAVRRALAVRSRAAGAPRTEPRVTRRGPGVVSAAKAAITTRGRSAVAKMVTGRSDEELVRRFGSAVAQRTLFTAMAQGFQPRMAFGFTGVIQIELRPGARGAERAFPEVWTLRIDGRRASAHREATKDPAVTIRTDLPTFMRLFAGELNPLTTWVAGNLEIEGDVMLGPRMLEMFGGVRPFEPS